MLHAVDAGQRLRWLAVYCAIVFLGWVVLTWGFVEDDAFVHLEFARNVAEGRGFSFDGHAVFGDSSPLWVGVLVPLGVAVGNWIWAAKLASIAAWVFACWATFRLAVRLVPERTDAAWTTLVVLASPYVLYWSTPGMESVLALGVALWILAEAIDFPRHAPPRIAGSFALMGLAPLVRFELALLVALAGAALLLAWRPLLPRKAPWLALCAVVSALPTCVWLAYAHHALGSVVPTTSAAKRLSQSFDVAVMWQVARRAATVFGAGHIALAAALALILLARRVPAAWVRSRISGVWLLLAWPVVLVIFYVLNRTAVQTRYAILAGSPLLLWAARVLADRDRVWLRRLLLTCSLVLVVQDLAMVAPHAVRKVRFTREMRALAEQIRERVPPDAPIAIYAIGQVAFEVPQPIIDTGGLIMPEAVPYLGDSERMQGWALERGAACFVDAVEPPPGFVTVLSGSLTYSGWGRGPGERYNVRCRVEALEGPRAARP